MRKVSSIITVVVFTGRCNIEYVSCRVRSGSGYINISTGEGTRSGRGLIDREEGGGEFETKGILDGSGDIERTGGGGNRT